MVVKEIRPEKNALLKKIKARTLLTLNTAIFITDADVSFSVPVLPSYLET